MSLISDTDYLIHSLRLSYLRNVDDPYGSRIISLDSSYSNNPYITAASLADKTKWPELTMPSSPQLSDNEGERPSGFPGATGLKHTQTIMGGRSGGMGLRTTGKRNSTSRRMSGIPQQAQVQNYLSENHESVLSSTVPTTAATLIDRQAVAVVGSWSKKDENKAGSPAQVNVQIQEPTVITEAPVKTVQFIPKFKGAAEMEARRRVRMQARRGPGAAEPAPAPLPLPVAHDFSSSEEEEEEVVSDDFDAVSLNGSLNDGDDFDPDFAVTRIPSDSASEILSPMSAEIPTGSPPSTEPNFLRPRHNARLSPVTEHRGGRDRSPRPAASSLEMPIPAPKGDDSAPRKTRPSGPAPHPSTSSSHSMSQMSFPLRKVSPASAKPIKSALSAMLASSGSNTNPFSETYAAISGRAETASTNVQVYFPHARQPLNKAMYLNVRKDATMEEVIGFALWNYWEEGWQPKLDEGLSGEDDPKWETKLSAVGWIMRIAEDDGEVDDEFPPPDRTGKIAKFNFDAYAVLEATQAQIQQNQLLETKIQRAASRPTPATKKPEKLAVQHAPGLLVPPMASSAVLGSYLGSVPLSTSLGPSSSYGPQIFLRIRVADTADAVHISTTIPVSAGMYMQEALELVCRKRKLQNPKDYALLLGDMSILIPLDRTVASLQGKRELVLVKRSMLNDLGGSIAKGIGKTNDPNASIFSMADVPATQQYSSSLDYMATYKRYTIYRKMPMLVARQERTLAIDGVYIRIMPSTNKPRAVFDNGKTSSYHIKSIANCEQSTKSSSIFKLVLNLPGGTKRYDFEAESPKLATEIVQSVKSLKAALERSSTVSKSRRSRPPV